MNYVQNFKVGDKTTYPKRQIHLDFHTSPHIPGIGSGFSKEQFQKALLEGHVSSISVFAKCHHGLCYFPTKVGTPHPGLTIDLLGSIIEAAHEIGVRVPIYITAGWSDHDSYAHPEWISRNAKGEMQLTGYDRNAQKTDKKPFCSWQNMCLNDGNTYTKHIYELTEEICQRYDVDGLFYDICFIDNLCYCDDCRRNMAAEGVDIADAEAVHGFFVEKHIEFMRKCGDILKKYHPNATIFFNSGGAEIDKPQYHPYESHYEMEDLPTVWGGYSKMAPRARFFEKTGKYFLGMTGKFHLSWGEFGGYKTKDALKYEVCSMAQYGAGCSVGDHLYPDGVMDMQTYKNIGYAYAYLEKIEPYCYEGNYLNNLGVYLPENPEDCHGVVNMLLENQMDFDYIEKGNFKDFQLVVFPSGVVLNDEECALLNTYIAEGGKVLFMGDSLQKDGAFQIDCGLKPLGESGFEWDYLRSAIVEDDGVPETPMFTYLAAPLVEVVDAEVYAETYLPLFNRTYEHFCGHANTPYDKKANRYPALAKKGNVVYMAHKMGVIYSQNGCIAHRDYFISALKNLLSYEPLVQMKMGSCGRVTALEQAEKNRICLNITYAQPVKRGCAEIIDEIQTLYDIPVRIKTDRKVVGVSLPLRGEQLPFGKEADGYFFRIPQLQCHETVVLEYEAN